MDLCHNRRILGNRLQHLEVVVQQRHANITNRRRRAVDENTRERRLELLNLSQTCRHRHREQNVLASCRGKRLTRRQRRRKVNKRCAGQVNRIVGDHVVRRNRLRADHNDIRGSQRGSRNDVLVCHEPEERLGRLLDRLRTKVHGITLDGLGDTRRKVKLNRTCVVHHRRSLEEQFERDGQIGDGLLDTRRKTAHGVVVRGNGHRRLLKHIGHHGRSRGRKVVERGSSNLIHCSEAESDARKSKLRLTGEINIPTLTNDEGIKTNLNVGSRRRNERIERQTVWGKVFCLVQYDLKNIAQLIEIIRTLGDRNNCSNVGIACRIHNECVVRSRNLGDLERCPNRELVVRSSHDRQSRTETLGLDNRVSQLVSQLGRKLKVQVSVVKRRGHPHGQRGTIRQREFQGAVARQVIVGKRQVRKRDARGVRPQERRRSVRVVVRVEEGLETRACRRPRHVQRLNPCRQVGREIRAVRKEPLVDILLASCCHGQCLSRRTREQRRRHGNTDSNVPAVERLVVDVENRLVASKGFQQVRERCLDDLKVVRILNRRIKGNREIRVDVRGLTIKTCEVNTIR